MIPTTFFEDYAERNKGKLNQRLRAQHDAHVTEQGVLVQDIHTTGCQIVTVVYLVRPNNGDLGEIKLASNVFQAWIRAILQLLKQIKGEK